jgi:hypothetical protein
MWTKGLPCMPFLYPPGLLEKGPSLVHLQGIEQELWISKRLFEFTLFFYNPHRFCSI